jgi:hypothetical protein
MSRGAHPFKQGDVTKAIKGAVNAGWSPKRILIDKKTGNIILFADHHEDDSEKSTDWDDVR